MNDSSDFQDAESVRSGHSHVASQPVSFPPHTVPGGMLSRSIGMPSRKSWPPSIWDTHGKSRNVFENPAASSSAPYPQELNPWSSNFSEQVHSSHAGKCETPFQDQRCQSGLSTKIHSSLVRRFFKEFMAQTNNDCGSQIFIPTYSPHQQHLLVGR